MTGSNSTPVSGICITCGARIPKSGNRFFCGEGCRPGCEAPGCSRKATGRKRFCATHMSSIYRHGRLPRYTWALEKKCIACGEAHDHERFRKFCSSRCKQLWHRTGGAAPDVKQCNRCFAVIDLSARHANGRKRRSDISVCETCRAARHTRHKVSVSVLAERDGTLCRICDEQIDMSARYPDVFRASVDHIYPYSLGGSHELSNLQLAHLWCNLVKQNREGFTI